MRKIKLALLTCILLLLASCASISQDGLQQAHYKATKHIFLPDVLPPPPVENSVADRQDLQVVLNAQRNRTANQIKEAQLDVALSIFRFQPVLGDKFTSENLPVMSAFFDRVKDDQKIPVRFAKNYYHRKRPYIVSNLVKPVVKQPHNASYPSGHTAFAYVSAILLAKMLPEKKTEIYARADAFSNNRLIAGVHYPSDITAGKISAAVIAHDLLQDQEFIREFNQARSELRHTLRLP